MATGRHTYLRTHRLAGRVMVFDTANEEAKVRKQSASSKQGRGAKTLVKEGRLRVTLLSLRKGRQGAVLGVYRVKGELSILVLRGGLEIGTSEGAVRIDEGGLAVLHAGVGHQVRALRDTTVLLTSSMR